MSNALWPDGDITHHSRRVEHPPEWSATEAMCEASDRITEQLELKGVPVQAEWRKDDMYLAVYVTPEEGDGWRDVVRGGIEQLESVLAGLRELVR